ncbi:MAG: hypothetical protein Q8L91_18200 [Polaromonas sp.]|nr:hypothetical protein [Polaromonas sp.]
MQQIEIAKGRLFDADAMRVSNLKLFPGTKREATAEQFAEQINKALSHLEADDFAEANSED